ncbi:MAG: gfo/Idh/MocA family oxidoreductase [Verrucomicrobia bacterium]|nr:MAG: gfo/Idh/MocA family oxidoreductase [Verrucomicrobiota bacterium]
MTHRRPIAWGILGTGMIARKLAAAIAESPSATLAAVGSRNLESARRFAREFGGERAFGSYDEVLRCDAVEAVYIALPNQLHAEWAMRAAALRRHVLCEKPLAVNRIEAERVIAAARSARVFLMEAFMYRCHPQTERLVQVIRDGDIGEVRLIQATFTFKLGPRDDIRLQNAAAGGGIMDVGCYPLSMARLIAGAARGNPFQNPTDITGTAHIGERSRVDELATASAKFPGGCLAALACGIRVASEHTLRIWGSAGHIVVPQPWIPPQKDARILVQREGQSTPTELLVDAPASLYAIEIERVADAIRTGDLEARSPCMSWADTLGNMAGLDAWRAAVGLTFDCERRTGS